MYTRDEFEELRRTSAQNMAKDEGIREDSLDLLTRADQYNWLHQTTWRGEPCIQSPEDLFAIQEIVRKHSIQAVIELGVAWGGTSLFCADLGCVVFGVDIYVPDDLRERIYRQGDDDLVELIERDTIEAFPLFRRNKNLTIIDSNHTHDHVLKELQLYSQISEYMVVCDTIIDKMPEQTHRPRDWGPRNNPQTALDDFLKPEELPIMGDLTAYVKPSEWQIDHSIQDKLLISCNTYLERK